MIVVDMPNTYRQERCYVLNFVFKQVLELDYEPIFHETQSPAVTCIRLPNGRNLIIDDVLFQTPEHLWLSKEVIPESPLLSTDINDDILAAEISDARLPILFCDQSLREGGQVWERVNADSIKVNFDLLGAIFFMLSRYEEATSSAVDSHMRCDSTHTLAVKNGFDARPLADEYIGLLRGFMRMQGISVASRESRYSIQLSHDLDRPYQFLGVCFFVKGLLGHWLKRRDWRKGREWLVHGFARARGRQFDPFLLGMRTLLAISEKYGLRSQINVMGASRGPHDDGYDPGSAPLRQLLKSAESRGHQIGFHPGYGTYNDAVRFACEKTRVEERLCVAIDRGRQHYLRMQVPSTWRIWHQAGILHDGSIGFPDRVGFRAGTCHTYTLFDLEHRCELSVRETPLVVMDGALKADFNEALDPDEAINKGIHLAKLCKKYGGTFSLLWHNSSLHGDWAGWERVYESIVKHAVELLDD